MNDEVTNNKRHNLDWLSNIPLNDYSGGAYPDLSSDEGFKYIPDINKTINIGVLIIKIVATLILLAFMVIAIVGGVKSSTEDTASNIITGCLVGALSWDLFEFIIIIWKEE